MKNLWNYQDEHRAEICEWMSANGIDPNTVAVHTRISIVNGVIKYRRLAESMSLNGFDLVDDERPMVVEPDEVVARLVDRIEEHPA